MAKLRFVDDLGTARLFDLSKGGVFGRDPNCDFVVDHPTVSRRHAQFTLVNEGIEVQDLDSANKTRINGRLLDRRPCLLDQGDQLEFGGLAGSFHSTLADSEATFKRGPGAKGSRSETQTTTNLLEHQMHLGRLVQRRILVDRPPEIFGYELGHVLMPALGVGGDFIHWGIAADGRMALVVGDVCGKGVPAAVYMAYVSGVLVEVVPTSRSAAEVLERVNQRLHPIMDPGMFVTAFAMLIDPAQHDVELARAGHAPAMLRRVDGSVLEVGMAPGLALGLAADADIGSLKIALLAGDVLVLTTDGVEEATNSADEEFGRWRVSDVVGQAAGARDAARRLKAAVALHEAGARRHDDITVVTLERCCG